MPWGLCAWMASLPFHSCLCLLVLLWEARVGSTAQRRFRIKPHLLSLQPVTSFVLTKVGGAEEKKDGARGRGSRRNLGGRWGPGRGVGAGEGRGGEGRGARSFENLLPLSPSSSLRTEAPSVHGLDAFAFVFHSVTASVRSGLWSEQMCRRGVGDGTLFSPHKTLGPRAPRGPGRSSPPSRARLD